MGPRATFPITRHGVKIMLAILSRSFVLRCLVFTATLLLPAMLLAETVRVQDFIHEGRDVVRAWTLHRIAEIQAVRGNINDAKNTVAEIDDPEYIRGEADVTGVCFCNGQVFYDHPPAPAGWSRSALRNSQVFPNRDPAPDRVPAAVPRGLPSNYLAADPRHGAVVNFTDEYDSYGTRVTSRRYADGYAVIETPRSDKNGR